MSDKVRVAVRVRPVNRREVELGTKTVVDMDNNQTILYNPNSKPSRNEGHKSSKTFAFDDCFWSLEDTKPQYAGQEKVYSNLGNDVLERAFEGYNACIFAYGQTGSGKSYTMMGTGEQKGIIPRLCDALFDKIANPEDASHSRKVEVSYMEIYNEKVHDLLDPKGSKQHLKVREHNILGPYVDGLSTLVVSSFQDIDNLMIEGNKSRTVAATNMNSESSRSHAVFNIILTQTITDIQSGVSGEKVSKLSLVDLAGSERAQKTGAVGERLKEGSNINKSLTTLGLVISALADQTKSKNKFVPYRDSVLTWLLKDNLGGNSKTVMIATISPAADNYEETLSTLRYADRAKRIVNHAVINEDPNARIIRELREEVDTLRKELNVAQMRAPDVQERLQESEKLMKEVTKTWEEKLAETDKIQQERHAALEKMGISVETSGIKVEQGKYFLVNLNSDPSLNELLVYYLKDHMRVGGSDAPLEQDIQLSGLGIMAEHCIIDIRDNEVSITPFEDARTCVNGSVVKETTKVKNGDRILWDTTCSEPDQPIDYDFAQHELMMKELNNDPINDAIYAIEKQHEEEKQEALERQRLEYENKMQMLRDQLLSPSTPSHPFPSFDALQRSTPTTPSQNSNTQLWAMEREKLFKQSLAKLRDEVMKAKSLVREANFLAQEMGKNTEYSVTLQIPAANLTPGRRCGSFVTEPAILVKRYSKTKQVCSMEKFENKIIDMKEMYQERKNSGLPLMVDSHDDWDEAPRSKGQPPDPFYESQENHNLIGVANIFLNALFYDIKLDYKVPIISQQGELAGKLHIELSKIGGGLPERLIDAGGECGTKRNVYDLSEEEMNSGAPMVVTVVIKEARGLPPVLSNFVFCQYYFWNHQEQVTVPPDVKPDTIAGSNPIFRFNHRKEFKVLMTEEFVEHISEGALSIEVWGHRSSGFVPGQFSYGLDTVQARSRSLVDRWTEVMRKVELWLEIHEVNDQGDYCAVEVTPRPEVCTGGVYQLRQGHSRRIRVGVRPLQKSGFLPVICESIIAISVGGIYARSKLQKGLDSYQERDLNELRDRWSEALARRKDYMDDQIQRLMNKTDKTDAEVERERSLIDQWVVLTEERNDVMVPAVGSGIPGAPADWDPPLGMETHIPVLYLKLNADDMSTPSPREGNQAAGVNSVLPKENGATFVNLPIIKRIDKEVCAVASWDTSMHDSPNLNRVTPTNERVYIIVKTTVRLSHPVAMDIVLRKRLCLNVYKRQILTSVTDMFMKHIIKFDSLHACGIIYEMVSNIPKASEHLEDKETLAQLAASQNDDNANDGETYIEKYIKGVSSVESILTLDRLRQEVAVKELLVSSGKSLRKTASVPNIAHVTSTPNKIENQTCADSTSDLTWNSSGGTLFSPSNFIAARAGVSPHSSRLIKPMRTLQEEQFHTEKKPLLRQDTDESPSPIKERNKAIPQSPGSDDFQDFESYESQKVSAVVNQHMPATTIKHSSTIDSLAEIQAKSFTPSLTSSGYDSQAISTLTLSSEDSISLGAEEIEVKDLSSKSSPKSCSNEEHSSFYIKDSGIETCDKSSYDVQDNSNQLIRMISSSNESSVSLLDENVPRLFDSPLYPFHDSDQIVQSSVYYQPDDGHMNTFWNSQKANEHLLNSDSNVQLHISDDDIENSKLSQETKSEKNEVKMSSSEGLKYLTSRLETKQNPIFNKTVENPLNNYIDDNPPYTKPLDDDEKSKHSNKHLLDENESSDPYSINALKELENAQGETEEFDHAETTNLQVFEEKPLMESGDNLSVKRSLSEKCSRPMSAVIPGSLSAYKIMSASGNVVLTTAATDDQLSDTVSMCSFGSRADLDRVHVGPLPSWIQPGESVMVTSSRNSVKHTGVIRYVGATEFSSGAWVGVELDLPEGKNDGSVNGMQYFKCRPKHGIFVRHDKLIWDKRRRTGSKKSPSAYRPNSGGMISARSSSSLLTSPVTSPLSQSFMSPTASSSAKKK